MGNRRNWFSENNNRLLKIYMSEKELGSLKNLVDSNFWFVWGTENFLFSVWLYMKITESISHFVRWRLNISWEEMHSSEQNFSSIKHVSEQSYYLVSCSFSKPHMLLTKKGCQFLAIQKWRNQFSMSNTCSIKCRATNGLQLSYLFCSISHSNFKPG